MRTSIHPVVRIVALSSMLLVGIMSVSPAQEKPKLITPKKLGVMERKLLFAQKVLEGLALEDFKKLETSADGLIECVKDASWKIKDTDRYSLHSNDFLRRAEDLRKAAKDKNINAAALAYVDMTLTCVKCHQYLRDTAIGRIPNVSPLRLEGIAAK